MNGGNVTRPAEERHNRAVRTPPADGRSIPTRLAPFAWILPAATVGVGLVFMVVALTDEAGRTADVAGTATVLIMTVALLPIGALVASRQPENPLGWIFTGTAFFFALGFAAYEYAVYAYLVRPGTPGGELAAWIETWFWFPAVTLPFTLLILLFPNGQPPSARWRPLVWVILAAIVIGTASAALTEGRLDGIEFDVIQNPVGVPGAETMTAVALAVVGITGILSFVSLILRLRRSSGHEREQLRFVVRAFAVSVVLIVIGFAIPSDLSWPVVVVAIAWIPIGCGIAVIRHQLWDVNVVVRKTLVYGGVSALLAGLYFGIVIGLQAAFSGFTRGNDLAIAGSTLAVAALFRPARARIQAFVDRRFYRGRYDAARTLEAFNARMRDEIDLDALGSELGTVVRRTLQPAHVSIWLRNREDVQ